MLLLPLKFNKRKLKLLEKEKEVAIVIPFDQDAKRLMPGDGIALLLDNQKMERLRISSMALLSWNDECNVPYTTGLPLETFATILGYESTEEYQQRIVELEWKPGEYAMLRVIARQSFGNPEQSEQKERNINDVDPTNAP